MLDNYSIGPSMEAEIAYRRERVAQAWGGPRRVWRGRLGRAGRAAGPTGTSSSAARLGAARPAH